MHLDFPFHPPPLGCCHCYRFQQLLRLPAAAVLFSRLLLLPFRLVLFRKRSAGFPFFTPCRIPFLLPPPIPWEPMSDTVRWEVDESAGIRCLSL